MAAATVGQDQNPSGPARERELAVGQMTRSVVSARVKKFQTMGPVGQEVVTKVAASGLTWTKIRHSRLTSRLVSPATDRPTERLGKD